jgi:hypothetical protein
MGKSRADALVGLLYFLKIITTAIVCLASDIDC